jgi:hypothetical protein
MALSEKMDACKATLCTVHEAMRQTKKLPVFILCGVLFAIFSSASDPIHAKNSDFSRDALKSAPYSGLASDQACPRAYSHIQSDVRFDKYFGATSLFHGGYRGFVGKEKAVDNLYPECFYDHAGVFIDANHIHAKCAGSADEYKASGFNTNTLKHWLYDRGGPIDIKQFSVTQFAIDGFSCISQSPPIHSAAHTLSATRLALNLSP